jgi:hypothetical protein
MAIGVSIMMVWTNQAPKDYANFPRLSPVPWDMQALGFVAVAILTIGQGYLPPISLEKDFLVTEQKVLFLGAPRAILEGTNFALHWSANGRYLAVHAERMPDEDVMAWLRGREVEPTRCIVIYDVQSDTTRTYTLAKGSPPLSDFWAGCRRPSFSRSAKPYPQGPTETCPRTWRF